MAGGSAPYRRKDRAKSAEFAAIIFDLRLKGLSLREIDALSRTPDGPTGGHRISVTTAKELIYAEAARRVDPRLEAWRAIQVERLEAGLVRLDGLEEAARGVLEREHVTVNNGRIISLDGEPLPDDSFVLQAIDRLTRIEESRRRTNESLRKILGLDAPARSEVQVTEVTQQDIELQEMIRDAKAAVQLEERQILDGGDA
ncbi:hypothetical protein [Streptomyces sp. N35]|uniref:hypothetical protein n=1 Tax=Streptomyces sp. N35 TaxID=2795730 RepID=UPI0018F5C87C|nr:hypothetical protein [Streptomyces sp. N35]